MTPRCDTTLSDEKKADVGEKDKIRKKKERMKKAALNSQEGSQENSQEEETEEDSQNSTISSTSSSAFKIPQHKGKVIKKVLEFVPESPTKGKVIIK